MTNMLNGNDRYTISDTFHVTHIRLTEFVYKWKLDFIMHAAHM